MHQPHNEQRICCQGKQADILSYLMDDCNMFENISKMHSLDSCKLVLVSHNSVNVLVAT